MMKNIKRSKGISLVEVVIVIAILGVAGSFLTSIIMRPIEAYRDTKLRTDLNEQAYIIINEIKGHVKAALPNSVRGTTNGNKIFLEVLTVSDGGRYRTQNNTALTGDILDFSLADSSFDLVSHPLTFSGGEKIVVANMGLPTWDAYNSDNMANYTGATGSALSNIVISPKKFPLPAQNSVFFVVNNVITYVCDKDAHTLKKYWNYTISTSQPNNPLAAPLVSGSNALLSDSITDCAFVFNLGSNSRNGQLKAMIKLENAGQKVTLYGDTNVPNM